MEADPSTLGLGALLAAVLIIEMRLLRKELKIAIAAIIERSRIRDSKRRKRESAQPHPATRRSPSHPVVVPDEWPEDESTDLHELMEIERAADRARRDTNREGRRGERPPRPGTHHDRED